MLVGLYPRISWWILVCCFATFLGVSLDRAIVGESSCGCFGRFRVHPWYVFALDATAILALFWAMPFGPLPAARISSKPRWILCASLALLGLIGLWATVYLHKAGGGEDGRKYESEALTSSPSGQWVGQQFPLERDVDVGSTLMKGKWAIMFYHSDCSTCRKTIPQFVGLAYHLTGHDRSIGFALIEVPRQGDASSLRKALDGVCLRGHLSTEHRGVSHCRLLRCLRAEP